MSNLFIGTEAKVFCLLILAFFWIFGIKNPQPNRAKLKYVYAFSGAGNLLLIVQGFVSAFAEMAVVLGFVVGVCYALAAYSWGVYAFAIKQVKMRLLAKIALVAAALAVGDIAYFSSVYGAGAILYAATFAVMAAFVVSQYNQIKIDNLTKLYNRYGKDEEIREQLQQQRTTTGS